MSVLLLFLYIYVNFAEYETYILSDKYLDTAHVIIAQTLNTTIIMLESKLKKYFLPLLAAIAVSAPALAAEPGIVVIDTDGSQQEIPLSTLDRISFGASQLTVQTKDGQDPLQYSYSSIDRIMIGKAVSSLAPLTAEGRMAVWPTVASSTVNVAGVPEGATVSVYSADGSLVTSATAGEGTATLDISSARPGLCIVTIGSQSVKIIKN